MHLLWHFASASTTEWCCHSGAVLGLNMKGLTVAMILCTKNYNYHFYYSVTDIILSKNN